MLSLYQSSLLLSSILLPLTSATAPTLRIHNTHTTPICFHLETSSGSFPTTTVCPGGLPGITVPASHTSVFHPSEAWNGALTPISGGAGTRFEINFSADQANTWYDADMEMGISAGTLGPTDHRARSNGQSSLAGEQDPLGKANAAFAHLDAGKKAALLKSPKYVQADASKARLTHVSNDKAAPEAVRVFFQLDAGFMAYMGAGSVAGKTPGSKEEKEMVKAQDSKSWVVGSRDMTVTLF
ncbi:MAG: hypothetical protein Q9222_003491 [Ikaeria aurantiellina]